MIALRRWACPSVLAPRFPASAGQALNNIVNEKSSISPETAIRLTKAFGSTEETWLRMQLAYDLAAARKDEGKIKVHRQRVPRDLHVNC
jgi:addiction module HigA family antidote